ncbi:MAG: DUF429 domain-containing protein [Candidatus Aenigmatarchaeota archaeon]|nr:MAG: DUF429 domain-containing protein [Candidatus Aenigmarchaeota archaeon]
MLFVGVDLAWSDKNGSGVAVIEGDRKGGRFLSGKVLFSDEEIIDFIKRYVGDESALIAVDAPLVVPNERGRRDAEKLVGLLFRGYNAGAHPANRKRLSQWSGKVRGEEIAKLIEGIGFVHNPYIERFEETRAFFEVYPHPSMVVLFNLDRIIQYKSKPKRDYEFRWREFERYQNYLKSLGNAEPSLTLPEEITERNVRDLRNRELKDFEDLLDAVFCAYIAYYCWVKPERCAVLGDLERGYILTPVFEHMKKRLRGIEAQRRLSDF